jgi:hypothetical protein
MNRYLKSNGSIISPGHKKKKKEKQRSMNIRANKPDKIHVIHHSAVVSGVVKTVCVRFTPKMILAASGNHQFKKKEYYTKGSTIQTKSVFINFREIPVELLLVQHSRANPCHLSAKCQDETQELILSTLLQQK